MKKIIPIIILVISLIGLSFYYMDYLKQVRIINNLKTIEDINKYKTINKNTIGYIKVKGTKVDFPVVQYKDNDYYLKHSFDNSKNKYGWVFMDYRNDYFNDMNTIIYGHTIDNKLMFASLKNILSDNSINEIEVYENEGFVKYQIFSVYIIEPVNDYLRMNFPVNEYDMFLNDIKERSIYDYGIDVNVGDKILTLSTCYQNDDRLVIHAKKL